ncbi:MAG TPA: mechanosensitive ion channel family protein [Burkholderiales bacterium]|nr:mechanosensitive ion channel family protein [Burkholderiales bacterium]
MKKLLDQVWRANELYDWAIFLGIALGVLLALAVLRFWALRALKKLSARTATALDDIAVEVVESTRLWLLLPVALYAGASVLDLPSRLDRLAGALAVVAATLQAALWIDRFIRSWLERRIAQMRGANGETITVLSMIGFAGQVLLWVMLLLLVLDQLNFNITALVAGLGVGGVAVALAVQNILGDLFASLSIVLDKPFVVGDFIVVDNLRGTVERVGIKTTRVRSLDGELMVFSNTDLLKSRIRNFKRMSDRRVEFTLGVSYHTPLDKLRRIPQWLREIVKMQQRTRLDRAHFKQYGEWALVFEVVYYVLDSDYNLYMDVQQAINLAIFERLEREGVEFADPTRTVHVTMQREREAIEA